MADSGRTKTSITTNRGGGGVNDWRQDAERDCSALVKWASKLFRDIVYDRDERTSLIGEAFTKALDAYQPGGKASFITYFRGVALNVLRNSRRDAMAQKRTPVVGICSLDRRLRFIPGDRDRQRGMTLGDATVGREPDPATLCETHELTAACLRVMNYQERAAVTMLYGLDGHKRTERECGRILGCSQHSAHAARQRALTKCRKLFSHLTN